MKILITGGHLSPALSVISQLGNENILYVGRKTALEGDRAYSLEYSTIKNLGVPFASINAGRLQRKLTKHTALAIFKFPVGIFQAFFILKKFKPDIVLGFGSYVSLPVIIAAYFLGIPVVIHEQTLEAGASNRIAGRFATKICISFESSRKFFPDDKVVLTGNPLRKEILEIAKITKNDGQRTANFPMVYITGGSLGSHFVNGLVGKSIGEISKNFRVLHQTGDSKEYKDFDFLHDLGERLGQQAKNYTIKKFLTPSESAGALAKADIVVSRSGINTVCELLYLGKPCILIPLPFSQGNEQLKNALFIKKIGLAEVLEQKSTTPEIFIKSINDMYENISSYGKAAEKSRKQINENAALNIIGVLKDVYKKKKNKK